MPLSSYHTRVLAKIGLSVASIACLVIIFFVLSNWAANNLKPDYSASERKPQIQDE